MTRTRRFHVAATLVAMIAAAGCGSRATTTTDVGHHAEIPTAAFSGLVRVMAAEGIVEARLVGSDEWQRLDPAGSLTGVRQLRALGSSAMISLAAAADKPASTLWLRTNTVATLAEDGDGALYLGLEKGSARLNAPPSGRPVFVQTATAMVRTGGRDVLVGRGARGSTLAFTSEVPSQADWTHAVDTAGLDEGFGRLTSRAGGESSDLELRRVNVTVETDGGWAMTAVEHIFYNKSAQQLEGSFRFPVPAGAMVESLAMEINGRLMEGEIVEKEKARKTYEKIVDNMLDPALLEWEQGNWFKLRVFPIEPSAEKRVIIRYASPLRPTLTGYEYRFAAAAADMQSSIAGFSLSVDGQVAADVKNLDSSREVVVAIDGAAVPLVAQQVAGDFAYTAIRVRPEWSRVAAPSSAGENRVMILFDTSRSALEGRALALATLERVLDELEPGTTFALSTLDVTTTRRTDGFVPASRDAITKAIAAASAVEMDGASDLAAAFEHAAGSNATSVIYIGDGTPTWGISDETALTAIAQKSFASAPVFAALIGKGASTDLWTALAGQVGGRAMTTKTPLAARRFAFLAARAPSVKRLEGVAVQPIEGAVIYPDQPTTLYDGDELVALVRTSKTATPAALEVRGRASGKIYSQSVVVSSATSATRINQQWAARHIARRTAEGAEKEEIVALSRDHGILSRHTSLLVLESEEAYREHQIDRRRGPNALAANQPRVTGGDLESLGDREASLSPDHIQPGDPEITVPAPADAQQVVVIFPFGDTKLAVYDAEQDAWIARFLIDKDTEDGDYKVTVVITHADGRVERKQLGYTVDTVAPEVRLTLVAGADNTYWINARQQRPAGHRFGRDVHRVEVQMPDGQIINLSQMDHAHFARRWKPLAPVSGDIALTITATDRALNQSVKTVTISVPN